MAKRNEVSNIAATELGFQIVWMSFINFYDHLTPRLQELFHKSNRYKRDQTNFKFC